MDKLDPETIIGDYNEAYQRWTHYFNKASNDIDECFDKTVSTSFIPIVDPCSDDLNM